jgi:hypothetical protein
MMPLDAHTAWVLVGLLAALVLAWAACGGWGRGE